MRGRVGDIEFDFIVSGKSGKGILLTVVDRKLRKAFIEKILPVSITELRTCISPDQKARFPEMKTATTDNDLLLQHHKRLEKLLGIKIYFCHPYHSWEKGSIEDVNGGSVTTSRRAATSPDIQNGSSKRSRTDLIGCRWRFSIHSRRTNYLRSTKEKTNYEKTPP